MATIVVIIKYFKLKMHTSNKEMPIQMDKDRQK